MIIDYIDAYRHRFGVAPICTVLNEHGYEIAPSTYYAAKARGASAAELADAHLANALLDLYTVNRGLYGVRKMWHAARRQGWRSAGTRSPGSCGLPGSPAPDAGLTAP